MHFFFNGVFLLAAIKWGDWRRWKEYYPTILFFIIGDLLQNFILYNHWMWTYQETIFAEHILKNHTIISLMIMFIVYPSTVLIYLGRFPQVRWKQMLWIGFWISLYLGVEYINLKYLHLIRHHNGWTLQWSLLFNIIMFFMLKLHMKKPLLVWILSFLWILFLLKILHVPIDKMK
jgi:hypothetical protein